MARTTPISILALDEITSIKGLWIPASTDIGGELNTGRYSLEALVAHVHNIQLERRISFALLGDATDFLCPEITTLYKVVTKNVSKLEYSTDNRVTWNPLATTGTIDAELPVDVVYFRIERLTVANKAYISFSDAQKSNL